MPTSPVVIFCLVDDQIEGNPECLEAELVSFFCALMERARRKVREISHATSPMQLLGRLKTLNKATTTTWKTVVLVYSIQEVIEHNSW
jgi:hypothetical protein